MSMENEERRAEIAERAVAEAQKIVGFYREHGELVRLRKDITDAILGHKKQRELRLIKDCAELTNELAEAKAELSRLTAEVSRLTNVNACLIEDTALMGVARDTYAEEVKSLTAALTAREEEIAKMRAAAEPIIERLRSDDATKSGKMQTYVRLELIRDLALAARHTPASGEGK
jgi:chromosome segregation ATPase